MEEGKQENQEIEEIEEVKSLPTGIPGNIWKNGNFLKVRDLLI